METKLLLPFSFTFFSVLSRRRRRSLCLSSPFSFLPSILLHMTHLLLRSGASLFPGLLRISCSVTPEAAEAAEARVTKAEELAAAALKEAPALLPPLKSAAAVAAASLNASELLSRVAVAVSVGSTDLLVFAHKVNEGEKRFFCFFLFSSAVSHLSLTSSLPSFLPSSTSPIQSKAALVYKTLLSHGKTIASVSVGAVKDAISTAPLSSFELSLLSSAAFAQAAAVAGWFHLNQSTFLSVDPFDASSSTQTDCVVARVLDDGSTAAASDVMLVSCRVAASRLRRVAFDTGAGDENEGNLDLAELSASVRGKIACVLPTLEEVLLVDAVPRMEGDQVLVEAWAEAVGENFSTSSISSFSSSRFWLRAIPRIEVEDDCGDGEELLFATSEKGKREGKLVPPGALLASPAFLGNGGNNNFLLGAFLSALTSSTFSELWGGKPLAVEGTARLVPRPPAAPFGRPPGMDAAAAAGGFVASFSWAGAGAAAASSGAPAPLAAAMSAAAFPVDLSEYKISPLVFDVPAEAAKPSELLASSGASAAGETETTAANAAALRERKSRRPVVEPSAALLSALAAAAEAAAAAAEESKQRRELQLKVASSTTTATMILTKQAPMKRKKLGSIRLPVSSGVYAFRRKRVVLKGVRASEFCGGMFAGGGGGGGAGGAKKKGGVGGGGGKAPAAAKRKAPAAAAGGGGEGASANAAAPAAAAPAKKAKAPKAPEDPAAVAAAVAKLRAYFAAGEQAKLTNDELKAFLKSSGKTVGGTKPALIERALGAIGGSGGGGGGAAAVEAAPAVAAAPAPAAVVAVVEEVAAAPAAPVPTAVVVEAGAAISAAPEAVFEPGEPELEEAKPATAAAAAPPLPPQAPPLSPVAAN